MIDWKLVVINSNSSIRDAMRVIDNAALRIGMVSDGEGKLLGTVTDGDIRRGLLLDCEMQDAVIRVMNKNPTSTQLKDSREQRIKLMNKYDKSEAKRS